MLTRHNRSILSDWEARLLAAIARMLPRQVTPDHLTMIGVFGAVVALVSGILAGVNVIWLWGFNLGLLIHWAGDSLDGTVARIRKIERPKFGFFIDQMTDVLTNVLIAGGIIGAGYARVDVVLCTLICYQMLGMYSLINSLSTGRFLVTVGGLGPTEIRVLIILVNVLVFLVGAPAWVVWGIAFTWCDLVFAAGAVLMLSFFIISFVSEMRRLNLEDPRR